jgi:hypothetical protein
MSLHPTLLNSEVFYFTDAIREIVENYFVWSKDYVYNKKENEFQNKAEMERVLKEIGGWFDIDLTGQQ